MNHKILFIMHNAAVTCPGLRLSWRVTRNEETTGMHTEKLESEFYPQLNKSALHIAKWKCSPANVHRETL